MARTLCGRLPPARQASVRTLAHHGEVIDEALVLRFDDGASFTGEPAIEFQVHGSLAVIRRLETVLGADPRCRMAEAGEFTSRAMVNGRMDLTQVEGLADLISAETEAQLRQARKTFEGAFGRKIEEWRGAMLHASALVEASIDFADEEVPDDLLPEVRRTLEHLVREWRGESRATAVAERLRGGFEVAIVGAPNSGKSTLINAIAKREVAITAALPGTTRDIIEFRSDLGGLPVTFLDTAGVRETEEEVEALGIARTRERAAAADLRVFLDATPEAFDLVSVPGDIVVHGKCDLRPGTGLNVSGLTGEGLDALVGRVRTELEDRVAGVGLATRERHRVALRNAAEHLERALQVGEGAAAELLADDLRAARMELDVLLGRVDVEDVLGQIFSSFCIGK